MFVLRKISAPNLNNSVLFFLVGYFFADVWLLLTVHYLNLNGRQYVGGFHFHHSLFGLAGLLIALIQYLRKSDSYTLWFWWSIGVIFQHTLDEAQFVFITRD